MSVLNIIINCNMSKLYFDIYESYIIQKVIFKYIYYLEYDNVVFKYPRDM